MISEFSDFKIKCDISKCRKSTEMYSWRLKDITIAMNLCQTPRLGYLIHFYRHNLRQGTAKSTYRSWRSVSREQSFVRGEEIWLAPWRGSLMKIRQIFRSISDPGAFIIQQVTWTGELKFQYTRSDLYSRIKWLDIHNWTIWTSWSLRKIGANQRHLLRNFHVCSEWCTRFFSFCRQTKGNSLHVRCNKKLYKQGCKASANICVNSVSVSVHCWDFWWIYH